MLNLAVELRVELLVVANGFLQARLCILWHVWSSAIASSMLERTDIDLEICTIMVGSETLQM